MAAFSCIQHAIIVVKMMLAYLIPDEPEWVQTAVARVEYESKLAWSKQVNTKKGKT